MLWGVSTISNLSATNSINKQDISRCTDLIWVTRNGFTETVNKPVDKGANLDVKNNSRTQVLASEILSRQLDITRILVNKGVRQKKYGSTALMCAVGASIDCPAEGLPKIMELIKILITSGAKLDARNNNCEKALERASFYINTRRCSNEHLNHFLEISKLIKEEKKKRALRDWELVSEDFDATTF